MLVVKRRGNPYDTIVQTEALPAIRTTFTNRIEQFDFVDPLDEPISCSFRSDHLLRNELYIGLV